MAQLKSTSVTGNLSVTGNILASKIIKLDGTTHEVLLADGTVAKVSTTAQTVAPNAVTATAARTYIVQKNGDQLVVNVPWVKGESSGGTLTEVNLVGGEGITLSSNTISSDSDSITISHKDTSNQASITTGGRTYINSISLDEFGHVISLGTNSETVTDTGATSIEVTGNGNAVTSASYNSTTRKITLTKDTTFLTSHQTIPDITITDTGTDPIIGDITASGHTITVSRVGLDDLGLASAYKYKGSVAEYTNLPTSDQVTGDVYNVESDGMNYAWNGSAWDALGGTVDLSACVTGSGTANYIPKFTAAKTLGNSEIIDNGSNVYPSANLGSALGHASYIWDKAFVRQIELNRVQGTTYGRINFYSPSYYTWYEYMSSSGVASPTSKNTIQYGEVTSWARRSLIENTSGYGWIWEACVNSDTVAPVGKMALSSSTGNLMTAGSTKSTAFSIHSGGTTKATFQYSSTDDCVELVFA